MYPYTYSTFTHLHSVLKLFFFSPVGHKEDTVFKGIIYSRCSKPV